MHRKKSRLPDRKTLLSVAYQVASATAVLMFLLLIQNLSPLEILGGGGLSLAAVATPGYLAGRTITPREIFYGSHPGDAAYMPGGVVLDATYCQDGANTNYTNEIRAGWALGRITSSGLYRLCTRTRANGAGSSSASLTVDNAAAIRAGDALQIGSTTGTVSSVNYSTNVITLTATKTWSDNDVVYCTDGSGVCRGFLGEFIKLRDQWNESDVDKPAQVVVAGMLNQSHLLGDIDSIIAAEVATPNTQFGLLGVQIYSSGVRVF